MEKTIFEKIIDGEIPSYKIYEDEYVYSFLDVFPITKGHTLVIPKKHSRNILDCDSETAANIGRVLPKIANAVKEAYNCDGINIFQNNEEYAGQSVFHLHFHIVPRPLYSFIVQGKRKRVKGKTAALVRFNKDFTP